ncbi:MAG: helix-turn-helix transcriptional regulator [Clostridia bacterium]|nr:helix-turn-helix transcriptional regulator [Clostridia bacterium]
MDYRHKFKDLRVDNDLTQQNIAEICGVSDATVGHWENLKRDMKIDSIVKLCRFYNVSPEYIFGFTNEIKMLSDKK